MKFGKIAVVLLVALSFVLADAAAAKKEKKTVNPEKQSNYTKKTQIPDSYTAKFTTPDIVQTDPEGRLPKGGNSHCGPVSTSGTMMWLAENGYPKLVTKLDNTKETQFRLADTLGSENYMNATRSGTGADGLINSVCKYIEEKGYKCKASYQGWRDHPIECSQGDYPQVQWIKEGLIGDSAVLINIGWNKYDPNTDTYERHSGHWLSVVGYGVDENGKKNPDILVLRDSAGRAGKEPSLEFVKLDPIKSGMIVSSKGDKQPAAGLFKVVGGMHIKDSADFAILDSAVVIRLEKPEQKKSK